jgi:hypothetical protein
MILLEQSGSDLNRTTYPLLAGEPTISKHCKECGKGSGEETMKRGLSPGGQSLCYLATKGKGLSKKARRWRVSVHASGIIAKDWLRSKNIYNQ